MKVRVQSAGKGLSSLRSAFTLAEVLIAVSGMLIVFVALYQGMTLSFAITRAGRENLRATQVILERLEGLRLYTWNQILDPALNPRTFTNSFVASGLGSNLTYNGTVTITTNVVLNPPASYSSNILMVTVAVRWTSGVRTNTRSMSTYVSRFGVQNYVYNN